MIDTQNHKIAPLSRLHYIANHMEYEELESDKEHSLGLKLTYYEPHIQDTLTKIIYVDLLYMAFMGKTFKDIKLMVADEFYQMIEDREIEVDELHKY